MPLVPGNRGRRMKSWKWSNTFETWSVVFLVETLDVLVPAKRMPWGVYLVEGLICFVISFVLEQKGK